METGERMAANLEVDHFAEARGLLREGSWDAVRTLFEDQLTRDEQALPEFRLAYAISLLRGGAARKGLPLLDRNVMRLPQARDELRRYVVSPLAAERQLELPLAVLDVILEARPGSIEDLRLRASMLGRQKKWAEAIRDARQVLALRPDDAAGHTAFLQLLLQSGDAERAGAHADTLLQQIAGHPRLANIALLALTRSGRKERAADLAMELSEGDVLDDAMAAAVIRTLLDAGRAEDARSVGERLVADGWDDPTLRACLAQSWLLSTQDNRYEQAIAHLEVGLAASPDDVRMNSSMGEALLRTRQYDRAIPYLKAACLQQPKVPQPRALLARALKQAGRHAEAAAEFRRLLEQQPSSSRWRRYAAGALSQAGRRQEAAELFDAFVSERKRSLPRSFEQGLSALWGRLDEVDIPQARLDWAWSLSRTGANDRYEWERRARWGHLADHYLLDWLECRDDRVHDAMERLADLTEPEQILSQVDATCGMILASAHIGPMYAGPLALELLGIRSRWLASTPSVARTAYARSLISTSDQDDLQVARAFMQSLKQGYAVVLAVDGAINLAAPRIMFEGQEITYSSFAARTAHRTGVPSFFCAPRWEGERIGFVLERLPDAEPGEKADDHAERWRVAYLDALRRYLGGAPENLRLSGGLWRHIR